MKAQISITKDIDLPRKSEVIDWFGQLAETLKESNQRLIVTFQGKREWCLSMLKMANSFNSQIVVSNFQDVKPRTPFSKAETLLGLETQCVVYDGFSGINTDVLCMAAGLVKAGGVLMLLLPQDVFQMEDKYGQWQGRSNQQHYFFKYLLKHLTHDMIFVEESRAGKLPPIKELMFSAEPEFIEGLSSQQHAVLLDMNDWLQLKQTPVFVLTADRGRGKSTLLGQFAQQHQHDFKIVVTAASKAQASILLKQIDSIQSTIEFIAPDEIIRRNAAIDCLIIDEAAMLPNSMLQQCLELSNKTLMATTTGGYEGTGQGFLIKFMGNFDRTKLKHRLLLEAIRWGQKDEMESWFNRVLMLNVAGKKCSGAISGLSIQTVTKEQLNEDYELLTDIYALLTSAHYRTRPSDLRQLMDDENQRIIITRTGKSLIGVLLLNMEGGFDAELSHQVFMGIRRPQGHLFAQMITAQAGVKDFAVLKGLRVQRIAVDENFRKQGVGRLLIESAEKLVKELQLNYLASSFALDPSMSSFWNKMGFKLIHIAAGKGKSTGRQTVAVIKSVDPQVVNIVTLLTQKITGYLPVWLLCYCQRMLSTDVYALLEILNAKCVFSTLDKDEVIAFAEGYRGFDLSQAVLQKLLISRLIHGQLEPSVIKLLIDKILLNKDWGDLSNLHSTSAGKKEMIKQLRLSVRQLNE
ncbi:MAG: tRNA(Met) cytidine acetyltransferase [Gammaproteobacteria bacterium]|nr:tRNA(Met) cytidine acetyltransferase [Gammaproteobacteria bacterium]